MSLNITVQNASKQTNTPNEKLIENWVNKAFLEPENNLNKDMEMTVRIVDEEEGTELNQNWRNKTGPTNVLSFPYQDEINNDNNPKPLLGDVVICAPVVKREAKEQGKQLESHWAHMLVHGTLHLLGYDHIDNNDANEMEALECSILSELGYPDPYVSR